MPGSVSTLIDGTPAVADAPDGPVVGAVLLLLLLLLPPLLTLLLELALVVSVPS